MGILSDRWSVIWAKWGRKDLECVHVCVCVCVGG